MTGRLLGDSTIPPEDPQQWDLKEGTIYGCTLCHLINNPSDDSTKNLYELRQVGGSLDVAKVNYEIFPATHHGPSFDPTTLPSTESFSICVSMGHIYTRKIDIADVNLSRYMVVDSDNITIVNEELPVYTLVFHRGVLYNLTASVITNLNTELSLVNLNKAHHKLANARENINVYNVERYNFIRLMDEYLAPPEVKTDTEYGIKAVKFLIGNIDFHNNPNLNIDRIPVESALGKVYKTSIVNDKLVLKYQKLLSDYNKQIWDLEKINGELINSNLDHTPNLPYPYTYNAFKCANIDNVEEMKTPSCPVDDFNDRVGVFVQEYVESIGSLYKYVIANPDVNGLATYLEAMATLAEAHQGDTVRHHFMHLDAHGDNFLVSTCGPEVRSCDNRHTRVADLGGFKFKFGTLGGRVYMIDFGFSHFLENYRDDPLNSDLPEVSLGNRLYPAYDLITLQRGVLPSLIINFRISSDHPRPGLAKTLTKVLTISALLTAENIVDMVEERIRTYRLVPLDARENNSRVMLFDVDTLSAMIHDISSGGRNIEPVQLFLIDYISKLSKAIFEFDLELLKELKFNRILSMLCGLHTYNTRKSREMIRTIHQMHVHHLPDSVIKKLKIRQAPSNITGIPLLLWYISEYGIRLPIV